MNGTVIGVPTADEIVARAEAMIPWLREKADAVEKARQVPGDTIQAFQEAVFLDESPATGAHIARASLRVSTRFGRLSQASAKSRNGHVA